MDCRANCNVGHAGNRGRALHPRRKVLAQRSHPDSRVGRRSTAPEWTKAAVSSTTTDGPFYRALEESWLLLPLRALILRIDHLWPAGILADSQGAAVAPTMALGRRRVLHPPGGF